MAFCTNCGQEIPIGTKFCANCGTAVDTAPGGKNDQRKTVYDGEVHKCPNCGEVLDSFAVKCPSCGYEFRGAKASSSVKEFATSLAHAESTEQKITLIRNFPIPNTKEDVLEFMILSATNFNAEYSTQDGGAAKEASDAWLTKIEQSYHKAKLLFVGDKDFSKIQNVYDQVCSKIRMTKNKQKKSMILSLASQTIGLWGGLILFIIAFVLDVTSVANTSMIHLGGSIVMIVGAFMVRRQSHEWTDVGVGIACGVLALLLGTLLRTAFRGNGSMMVVTGGVTLIVVIVRLLMSSAKRRG